MVLSNLPLMEDAIIDDNLGYTNVNKDCLTTISFPSKLLFNVISRSLML